MSKKITIGVLLANSTILPMAASFNTGLKQGLNGLSTDADIELEIVPEFIGQGSSQQIEAAVNKFIGFYDTDIITGVISNRAGSELAEKFAKHKRPIIINNIGEHLPDPKTSNDYVFLNSSHTWQQVWSMGKWAVETFGKKGMLVSGLYDSGYSFPIMLQKGMEAASDEALLPFAVAPVRQYKALADVASVIPQIINQQPDFVFAAFCGEEASIFLTEYLKNGLHKKIPLLGLPFLITPFDAGGEEMDIYTTTSAYRAMESDETSLPDAISSDPFRQFGFETGMLIKNAAKLEDGSTLQNALSNIKVDAGRGDLDISPYTTGNTGRVFLLKNTTNGVKGELITNLVSELDTIKIDNRTIIEINEEVSSGWYNPYLSI